MGDPTQTCFNASKHDWPGPFEVFPDEIAVDKNGSIRTLVVDAPWRIIITLAPPSCRRKIGNHGIDAAGRHAPKELAAFAVAAVYRHTRSGRPMVQTENKTAVDVWQRLRAAGRVDHRS